MSISSLHTLCFAEDNLETVTFKPDNYLLGMAVRKTFTGDYAVKMRFKNNTSKKYKLKELGNNSYALILPQVRSVIGEQDIYFENEHDGLKIVFSEKKDLVKPGDFYTQINFRTKNTSFLRIQALAESSKKSETKEIQLTNDNIAKKHFPNWVWYFSTAFLFICFALFMLKKQTDEIDATEDKQETKIRRKNNGLKPKNKNKDLKLMPGTPELPFLDNKQNKKQKSADYSDNKDNIDLYNPENIKDTEKKSVIFPDRASISERFKNRNLSQDIDNLIFLERDSFLEKMSPISDITSDVVKKDNTVSIKEEDDSQSKYDKLMDAFKKVLKIAHKITDDTLIPEVTDAFAISDEIGFCLVEYGEKTSLVGNIGEKVFLIRTFSPEELNNDTLFMEFCTESGNSQTYSVILNNFKALIRVTDSNISLIEDYTG